LRYVVDLECSTDDQVEGRVSTETWPAPRAFSGWLHLLELLEPRATPAGAGATRSLFGPTRPPVQQREIDRESPG